MKRLLPLIIILLATVIFLWFTAPNLSDYKPQFDHASYLSIARDIRHLHFTGWPPWPELEPGTGTWQVFPPGYPLLIALMPTPISATSAGIATSLSFLAAIILVYFLLLRYGTVTASAGAASWAIAALLLNNPALVRTKDAIRFPWSEMTFIALLLGAVLCSRWPRGSLLGLAILTRPEGWLVSPFLILLSKNRRIALLTALSLALVVGPYLLLIRVETGRWNISPPGKEIAWARNPYFLAGIPVSKIRPQYPNWPAPGSMALARQFGAEKSLAAEKYSHLHVRIQHNLLTASKAVLRHHLWPFFLFGIAGLVLAGRRHDKMLLKQILLLFLPGLIWPFYNFVPRFFLLWALPLTTLSGTSISALATSFGRFLPIRTAPPLQPRSHTERLG